MSRIVNVPSAEQGRFLVRELMYCANLCTGCPDRCENMHYPAPLSLAKVQDKDFALQRESFFLLRWMKSQSREHSIFSS